MVQCAIIQCTRNAQTDISSINKLISPTRKHNLLRVRFTVGCLLHRRCFLSWENMAHWSINERTWIYALEDIEQNKTCIVGQCQWTRQQTYKKEPWCFKTWMPYKTSSLSQTHAHLLRTLKSRRILHYRGWLTSKHCQKTRSFSPSSCIPPRINVKNSSTSSCYGLKSKKGLSRNTTKS